MLVVTIYTNEQSTNQQRPAGFIGPIYPNEHSTNQDLSSPSLLFPSLLFSPSLPRRQPPRHPPCSAYGIPDDHSTHAYHFLPHHLLEYHRPPPPFRHRPRATPSLTPSVDPSCVSRTSQYLLTLPCSVRQADPFPHYAPLYSTPLHHIRYHLRVARNRGRGAGGTGTLWRREKERERERQGGIA